MYTAYFLSYLIQKLKRMFIKQESIPVGCVSSAAVTVGGGGASGGEVVYFPGMGVCVCPRGVCFLGCVYPSMH